MIWNIALIGTGNVGKGFLEVLFEKKDFLREHYDFNYRITCIATRTKGVVCDPSGLNEAAILDAFKRKGNLLDFEQSTLPFSELLTSSGAHIMVETTPTNVETAEPAMTHVSTALANRIHVVTANKGPVALHFKKLLDLAKENGVELRYEATVMSGTPIIDTVLHSLAGARITKLEGILNGTTNYMLTRMEEGVRYEDALLEAQKLGYAEADPSGDVDGWDAAVKVVILAESLFNHHLTIDEVNRTGISKVTLDDIVLAKSKKGHIRLVATIESDGRATVAPILLPSGHPLSQVRGVTNAACITTDTLGPVTLIGAGAGGRESAQGLLSDILNIVALSNQKN